MTRGAVLVLSDLRTLDWPARAKRAGLTTIATHLFPHEVAAFMQPDEGQRFWESCQQLGIQVEHELHAISDLLPRSLFDKDPTLFPANDQGQRVRDYNVCVHSAAALDVVVENAVKYTKILRATTHRYFFLEFAPIERKYDVPFRQRDSGGFGGLTHGRLLDALDANLAWFGCEGAQVLEYWLDLSRFSGWKRENVKPLPWREDVFRDDLRGYAERGIRHVTTFAAWLDGDYVKRFGEPPLDAYGAGLRRWRTDRGRAVESAT